MGADLISVKQEFTNLILNIQPWTLSHFMMWLDLKVAEYKIHGYLAIEQEGITSKDHGVQSENTSRTHPTGKRTIIIPQQAMSKICHCQQGDNKSIGPRTHELYPPMNFDASRTKRYSFQNPAYMRIPVDVPSGPSPAPTDSTTERSDHFQNFLYRAFMKNPALNSHTGPSTETPTPEYDSNDDTVQSSSKRFKISSPSKDESHEESERNLEDAQNNEQFPASNEIIENENNDESEDVSETVTSSENKSNATEDNTENDSAANDSSTPKDMSRSPHKDSTSEQISRIIIKEERMDDQDSYGGMAVSANKADTPEPTVLPANNYRDFMTFDMCSLNSQRSMNNRRTPERMSTDTLVSYLDLDDQMADRPRNRRGACTIYNISSTSENPILASNTENLSGLYRPVRKSGNGTSSSPGPIQERLSCDQCGHHFSTRSSLNRHKATHGEKKHRCFICSKAFHRKEHLCLHLERHLQTNDIACPTCNEKGHSVKWLEEHYRKWHQGSP